MSKRKASELTGKKKISVSKLVALDTIEIVESEEVGDVVDYDDLINFARKLLRDAEAVKEAHIQSRRKSCFVCLQKERDGVEDMKVLCYCHKLGDPSYTLLSKWLNIRHNFDRDTKKPVLKDHETPSESSVNLTERIEKSNELSGPVNSSSSQSLRFGQGSSSNDKLTNREDLSIPANKIQIVSKSPKKDRKKESKRREKPNVCSICDAHCSEKLQKCFCKKYQICTFCGDTDSEDEDDSSESDAETVDCWAPDCKGGCSCCNPPKEPASASQHLSDYYGIDTCACGVWLCDECPHIAYCPCCSEPLCPDCCEDPDECSEDYEGCSRQVYCDDCYTYHTCGEGGNDCDFQRGF